MEVSDMTKLTEGDIRQIIASTFADYSCTSDDIAFARAIEDAVLECAARICDDRHHNWRFGDGDDSVSGPKECAELIRAMKN
jgi:hypothetical protein